MESRVGVRDYVVMDEHIASCILNAFAAAIQRKAYERLESRFRVNDIDPEMVIRESGRVADELVKLVLEDAK